MHIAAALGTPTVGIFGGGHWPRFNPVGTKCLAVAAYLPCFYCDWDCIFGKPHCINLVTVNDVEIAIDKVLSDKVTGERIHYVAGSLPEKSHEMIAQASRKSGELKKQLLEAHEIIDGLIYAYTDDNAHYCNELNGMKNSLSWRVTAPLRMLMQKIKGE
jgi:hypothetical protein